MGDNDYSLIEELVVKTDIFPSLTVTVVIPFYAGLDFLSRTLAALSIQTYPAELIQVIIIEDGSLESVEPVVRAYRNILNIESYGIARKGFQVATCRNIGIRAAVGEVILSLDFDIVLEPTALAAHMRWFHVCPNVATIGLRRFVNMHGYTAQDVTSRFSEIFALSDIHSLSNTKPERVLDKRLPEIQRLKSHPYPCNCFHGCNVAYRRDDALQVGLWNEAFNGFYGYEDIEFGHRLFEHGVYLIYEPQAIGLHQENSFVSREQREVGLETNRKKLYELIPGLAEFREGWELAEQSQSPNGGGKRS